MKRDINKLCSTKYDMVIIGAGIQGAVIAYKAAYQGYRVCIIDKSDFMSGLSSNSLKIMHGGLRYLQQFDLKRMRASIKSRKIMMASAPSNVKPMGFFMPISPKKHFQKLFSQTALLINDVVSFDRNKGLSDNFIPGGKVLDRRDCQSILPQNLWDKSAGGFYWFDAIAQNTEHLGITFIKEAVRLGADAANYLKAERIDTFENKVRKIIVRDELTNKTIEISTGLIINSAGPWIDSILLNSGFIKGRPSNLVMGLNIVIKEKLIRKEGVCIQGSDKLFDVQSQHKFFQRGYFFVPWYHRTMIGTYYRPCSGHPDEFQITRKDFDEFLNIVNSLGFIRKLNFSDICFYHAGLLHGKQTSRKSTYALKSKTDILVHNNPKGMISVKTTKFTTAPDIADRVLKLVSGKSKIKTQNIHPVNPTSFNGFYNALKRPTKKEIRYFIDNDMAIKLSDIIFRRCNFGHFGCPEPTDLNRLACDMGELQGWSDKMIASEISNVMDRYSPLKINEELPKDIHDPS